MGFFDISGDTIKQADAAANFLLVIPPNAKVAGTTASWTEHGHVVETNSEQSQSDVAGTKMDILILNVFVEIDGDERGSGMNAGNKFKTNMRLNQKSLGSRAEKGSPVGKQKTMTNLSIHKMKAILRGCGIEPDSEDGGYSQTLLSECFPAVDSFTGVPSPMIGAAIHFEVRKTESPSKKDNRMFTNYEIVQVFDQ